VIRTALAGDPANRFASAEAMILALEEVAAASGWASGTGAIQRMMRELFGDVPEPWAPSPDDAPVTEPHPVAELPALVEPTRPERKLARGSQCEIADLGDDSDEPTRGRARMRRSNRSLAA
jgi:hypothetical protein